MIIAIDGPSGAGKSTVSDDLATKLGFSHLDTGAMFRAVAYYALQNNVAVDDEEGLANIAESKEIKFKENANNKFAKDVYIDGEDVTDKIRKPNVNKAVTPVCKHAKVRSALLKQQQIIAKSGNYILDGRDIGTVVFPDADLKIFLTADAKIRAKRRIAQLEEAGNFDYDFEKVLAEIERRDYEDSHRDVAPLKKADDAYEIDSTKYTKDEVVGQIYKLAKAKMKK